MAEGQTVAIVAYEVNAEDEDRFLEAWQLAQDYLKEQSGFVDTALHKANSAAADFRFVNVAHWESDDAFRDAINSDGFRTASGRLDPYPVHGAAYKVVQG